MVRGDLRRKPLAVSILWPPLANLPIRSLDISLGGLLCVIIGGLMQLRHALLRADLGSA
jgi:hypothetical protein